jgi:hypothetical protein
MGEFVREKPVVIPLTAFEAHVWQPKGLRETNQLAISIL